MEKYILEVKAYNELNDREEREMFMEEVEIVDLYLQGVECEGFSYEETEAYEFTLNFEKEFKLLSIVKKINEILDTRLVAYVDFKVVEEA